MQEALTPELNPQCGNPECSNTITDPKRRKFCCRTCTNRANYLRRGGKEYIYAVFLDKRYGLTMEAYQALVADHAGRCAICNDAPEQRLHIDHDHKSGVVRGLLCRGCNHALGNALDDPARLRAMADYLERHQQSAA
ncbi:endonuclease VII domain-containing protein [Streptomyces albidoflavus]|uniref:PCQ3_69 n=1 Tax=Streptomyces sp. W9 TaxID=682410 RepID=D0UZB8_9ACTN|nr:endonuclease VII domain-containing protein [Streptomyces sp. W9]ACX85570.1 pCQ3_69 [Streptomyces sp. W9]